MNPTIEHIAQSLTNNPPSIIYPEGSNVAILRAARGLADKHVIRPLLVSTNGSVKMAAAREEISLDGMEIIETENEPLNFAAQYLHDGRADAMVAGIDHATREVVRTALKIVGLRDGVTYASSMFVMDLPHFTGSENGLLIFSDCGMNITPTAAGLADIVTETARSAQTALGWEPRIAMLSYSTKGSAAGDSVELIAEALRLVHAREPELKIDGEMQVDTALIPEVAAKKANDSIVAGHANILIFPDLNSGNIAYKITERLADGHAYGPILQGFKKPVSDLSRGSTIEDIIGVSILTAAASRN